MKKILLLLIPTILFGCTTPEKKAIATVSKERITQGEFDFEVARLTKAMVPEDYVMTEEEKVMFETQILNNMIMKKVYTKKLNELDIKVDESIIDAQFAQLVQQYGSEEAMNADIIAKGFTVEELREEFTYQSRLNELSKYASEQEVIVSEEDIKKYYDDNKETVFMQPAMINSARHILLTMEDGDKDKGLEDIKAIREKIINGMDFAEAAKQFSQGPSGPNGGQLGQFQKGQMVQEFELVAFALPLNEVSQPVLTQFGYHLILVEDRTDANYAPFDDTKEYISSRLKVDQFFENLEKEANIKKPDWAEPKV